MSDVVISVENLSKRYQLGAINTGTFYGDIKRWWARTRGLPDPYAKIGEADHGNRDGETLWALKDVNFQVRQGETLGIIGRNGAGKSTLLKILSEVTTQTSGVVKIKGRIASLLEVGTGFHPELTGRENIYLNGAILGMKKTEITRKFDEIVEFSGVEQFVDTPVKRYSSGMYVRLAFAVAAHLEPEILIVDEVLAVGDADFQKKCLGKMSDVAHAGRTVLFVSHNMSAVQKLCSNSILLDRGAVVASDVTDKVINQYLEAHTEKTSAVTNLPEQNMMPGRFGRGLRLLITDEKGQPRNHFKIKEKWTIRLEFEIQKELKHVIAAIGLVNESVPLATYFSKATDLKTGCYYVDFLCDLPLSATQISIAVGLSEHERTFYYAQDIASVDVEPVAIGEQPLRTSGVGILLGHQDSIIHSIS